MNPLDRIAQLTERAENAEKQADMALSNYESAQHDLALLRSQLADARQQLERDSATIAKLAKDKREFVSAMQDAEFLLRKIGMNWREAGAMADSCKRSSADLAEVLSRHA